MKTFTSTVLFVLATAASLAGASPTRVARGANAAAASSSAAAAASSSAAAVDARAIVLEKNDGSVDPRSFARQVDAIDLSARSLGPQVHGRQSNSTAEN
ncbi:hypothetical protein F4809DRAFT_407651 [Biscogniauxia mediterranea]|nr:hypothetical protein F4809DRAFT_407651 [Biscogniauxia mediterranea]